MLNHAKSFLCAIICCISAITVSSMPVDGKSVIQLGQSAFHQRMMALYTNTVDYELKNSYFLCEGEDSLIAVLNFEQGFILMSMEDASEPVLAFSMVGDFDFETAAPAALMLVKQYKQELLSLRRMGASATTEVKKKWDALARMGAKDSYTVVISPLITAKWNQSKYYNSFSPIDNEAPSGYDNRTPNGCVAVAMSMIMYYYRYPVNGFGSHTNHTEYGDYTVDFSQQTYCYEAMMDELSFYNNEVAKLIFHAATAVDMMYGADGSGAYSEDVPYALATYFGYQSNCEYMYKRQYSSQQWKNMLKEELNAGRPVYYSGREVDGGGHAFVCDGYTEDDFFHFNFGWGGYSNGYYLLENNDSVHNAVGNYSEWQAMVRYIYPASAYPYDCSDKLINSVSGTIEDGSNAHDYSNNANCTYIITAPYMESISVNIQHFLTQMGHDSLSFWDGNPSQGHLLQTFSGALNDNTQCSFTADSLYVTFKTDDSVTDEGWRFDFIVHSTQWPNCTSQMIREYSGVLSDGSTDGDYRPNASCYWLFVLPEASYVVFDFHTFDVSPEDKLMVYDMSNAEFVPIATYTGNVLPPSVTFNGNRFNLVFVSDNYLSGDGFELAWHTDVNDDAVENLNMENISIYPNPVDQNLYVDLKESIDAAVVSIYDICGRQVRQVFTNKTTTHIDVSELPSGLYVLSCDDNKRIVKRKFVVRH